MLVTLKAVNTREKEKHRPLVRSYQPKRSEGSHLYFPVAQLAEHRTVNARVLGSSPSGEAWLGFLPIVTLTFIRGRLGFDRSERNLQDQSSWVDSLNNPKQYMQMILIFPILFLPPG